MPRTHLILFTERIRRLEQESQSSIRSVERILVWYMTNFQSSSRQFNLLNLYKIIRLIIKCTIYVRKRFRFFLFLTTWSSRRNSSGFNPVGNDNTLEATVYSVTHNHDNYAPLYIPSGLLIPFPNEGIRDIGNRIQLEVWALDEE